MRLKIVCVQDSVQKVRSLTQLTTEYAHVILLLFNINATEMQAGTAFFQSPDRRRILDLCPPASHLQYE